MVILMVILAALNVASSMWVLTSLPEMYTPLWLMADIFLASCAAFVLGIDLSRKHAA